MPHLFTPTALANHLACAHLTQLDRRRRAGESIPLLRDPRAEALAQRGQEHEAAYVARLRADGRTVVDLSGSRNVTDTLAAMRQGAGAIVQAPLAAGDVFGIADVLLRVAGSSRLGAHAYEPADTKLARETKAGTILQLCTYCELLAELQGEVPQTFHVVTPLAVETYRRADFAAYFRTVQRQLRAAAGATPPPPTYPEPVPHCDVCAYWQFCAQQRRADDHLSLVAGIHATHRRELVRQGVTTVAAFAASRGRLPLPTRHGDQATLARLAEQARVQVEARAQPLPPVEALPNEPDRGLARLPEPSPGDLFLDFEGDPFVDLHGREYLTGWCTRAGDSWHYEARWGLTPAAEKAALEAFLDAVEAGLAVHPELHVYHFGAYEPAALKRLCARHDTRHDALDRLLRGRKFVDLHAVVREGLRIGVERYGLKELEPLHGFARQLDLRDAAVARRTLELALEQGVAAMLDAAACAQVEAYNREDCESTAALRAWLETQRARLISIGQQISRPAPSASAPSEQVSARDARIAAARQALLQSTHDLGDVPRALLGNLLGYFRQEEKNAWWEHFRLRELPADERLAERQMLAGLRLLGSVPKADRQRKARYRFAFPPQETAIGTGDEAHYVADEDPAGRDKTTSVSVDSLDLERGEVVLGMGDTAVAHPPTAVFGSQVVPATALENALLDFAEHIAAHGCDVTGRYAAACSLLRRDPPRRATHTRLRGDGETTLAAIERACFDLDHGVLAVQGPPGTGKTYSGARAIAALVAAGKRVGVTAVSHKVIDNLLAAVGRAAREAGAPVRLVHKDQPATPAAGIDYVESVGDALGAVGHSVVVGGTAWLWAHEDAIAKLDYLFLDEAGQMALAQALAVARATHNLVLLGDPQQLDQPTRGAHPEGADVAALVHVIGADRATLGADQGLFLDTTWRLHPELCAFTSELYYDGRLRAQHRDPTHRRLRGATPFAGASLFLVEVEHDGNQAHAPEEVDAVARIAAHLLRSALRWVGADGRDRELTTDDVLVIAPYNAQVGALRRALVPLGVGRVGTVDKFQGQEAPVVIYSCTSSSALDAPRGMGFLYDPHRFNVATSRAEGVVILTATRALFAPECRTPAQMRQANGLCRFGEVARVVPLDALTPSR